ncbi:hypothetical protein GGH17_006191, partial [Coemansia sp. RSA 788]
CGCAASVCRALLYCFRLWVFVWPANCRSASGKDPVMGLAVYWPETVLRRAHGHCSYCHCCRQ